MTEGGGLLNRYTLQRRIEGSNPSVSAINSSAIPARAKVAMRDGSNLARRPTGMELRPGGERGLRCSLCEQVPSKQACSGRKRVSGGKIRFAFRKGGATSLLGCFLIRHSVVPRAFLRKLLIKRLNSHCDEVGWLAILGGYPGRGWLSVFYATPSGKAVRKPVGRTLLRCAEGPIG